MSNKFKLIHFIGIAGSAMGSVAAMLKEAGYGVQGSDSAIYPPMSDFLHSAGITVFSGFSASNITDDVDLVVVGNAISRGNAELEHVLDYKIEYTSFPEIISDFFIRANSSNKSIVVTGTHGKTTTSSLISWILHSAGEGVGFLIGGIPLNFGRGFALPPDADGYFVVEGDEYDTAFFDKRSKFLHYLPDALIINNVEFDHADIFDDIDDIKRSFKRLIKIVPRGGIIAANADDENVSDIIKEVFSGLVTYAIKDIDADYVAANIAYKSDGLEFEVLHSGAAANRITSSLKGEHNIYNILAAYAALDSVNIPAKSISAGIAGFKNVKRRLEITGIVNGITVYDDFAHHPSAIKKTICAMKDAYPGKRVIALFEPRSNTSRRHYFQDEFIKAFSDADIAIIAGVYNYDRLKEDERLDPLKLVEAIKNANVESHYIPSIDEICRFIADNAKSGDIILAMSSGSFSGIHDKIIAALEGKQS